MQPVSVVSAATSEMFLFYSSGCFKTQMNWFSLYKALASIAHFTVYLWWCVSSISFCVIWWEYVCTLVLQRGGLGSVPVSMHSPQSKVNTAAPFSSQPSAGSPQARARDHTPRPHTHTHTYAHTGQTSPQILPHTRIHTDHTTLAQAPRTQPSRAVILPSVRVHVRMCLCGQGICMFVHVYFQDDGGGTSSKHSWKQNQKCAK